MFLVGSVFHLAKSTLLDNYGATYIVNSKDFLVLGSFKKAVFNEVVYYGILSLLIIRRGKRVIENVMLDEHRTFTSSLTLSDVAIVDGFYINIISKALLYKKDI